jgi:hypothetical protein
MLTSNILVLLFFSYRIYKSLGPFFLFVLLSPKMTFVTLEELAALENLRVLFVRSNLYL